MQDDLAALHAAITAAPTDRTVRLVYADALDESGDPAHAARAEFVRGQIALQSLPDDAAERAALVARCDELFAAHWIDWWAPVCAAVGLPAPFVPQHRLRDRVQRFVRGENRLPGAPYTRSTDRPGACSIVSDELGFTAQFIAGFPELLYVRSFPPEQVARWLSLSNYFSSWADAVPLARIRFGNPLNDTSWQMLEGQHLERVAELTFDGLTEPTAGVVAHSPNLRNLSALKVRPASHPVAGVVRQLVDRPAWTGLRSLTLSGVTPPEAVQTLADRCTLPELEELTFGIGDVPEFPTVTGLSGVLGAALAGIVAQLPALFGPMRPGPIRWADYWPVLAALGRAPFLSRLRTLRVLDANASPQVNDLLMRFVRRAVENPGAEAEPDGLFPVTVVRALADGLNADRLVRLELPAARLAPASGADLAHRFGSRFVPV